jgi:CSLREA domain-containing protein
VIAMKLCRYFALLVSASAVAAPPANDNWATRTAIPVTSLTTGFTDTLSTVGEATIETTDPLAICKIGDPTARGNTVWYSISTGAQAIYINARASGYNSQIVIATGDTTSGLTQIVGGCNDDGAGGLAAQISGLRLDPNTSYSIQVSRNNQTADPTTLSFTATLATVRNVTKVGDTNDGACDADCSLREAINTLPANGGAVLIPAGTYLISGANGDNAGNSGDLDLPKGAFLYGAGAASTVLQSDASSDRILDIDPAGLDAGPTVGVFDLTLTGGNSGFGDGGCVRTPNQSTGPAGVGLPNEYLVINRSVISNCRSSLNGGAIASPGSPMHIVDSTVTGNIAASSGGGITFSQAASVPDARGVIERSTISNNESTSDFAGGGGGIVSNGKLVVLNSTIAGNRARFNGGGILVTTNNGAVRVENSTIAGNSADSNGNNSGVGGGIRFDTLVGSGALASNVQLINSVFADNVRGLAQASINQDCHATSGTPGLNTLSNWFEAPDSTCGIQLTQNVTSGDPGLASTLANNGGSTQTLLPVSGSGVINATLAAAPCNGIDQRSIARPQGSACDIGAVEVQVSLPDPIFANGFE